MSAWTAARLENQARRPGAARIAALVRTPRPYAARRTSWSSAPDNPPFPIEYKVGRRRPPHADLQLCAQALCLEEMLGTEVPEGAIYSHAERRRYRVSLNEALRQRTVALVGEIREQLRDQSLPPAVDDARCPPCSLVNACLPQVAAQPHRLRGMQGSLFRPLGAVGDDA